MSRPPQGMQGMGVSWFKKEDWPKWLSIDPEFQPDYEHWLSRSEAMFAQWTKEGRNLVKVPVDPDEFVAWSRLNLGGKVDTQARAAYVGYLMHKKYG